MKNKLLTLAYLTALVSGSAMAATYGPTTPATASVTIAENGTITGTITTTPHFPGIIGDNQMMGRVELVTKTGGPTAITWDPASCNGGVTVSGQGRSPACSIIGGPGKLSLLLWGGQNGFSQNGEQYAHAAGGGYNILTVGSNTLVAGKYPIHLLAAEYAA